MGLNISNKKGSDGYLCHAQPKLKGECCMAESRHMADIISGTTYRVGSLGRPSNFLINKLFVFVLLLLLILFLLLLCN